MSPVEENRLLHFLNAPSPQPHTVHYCCGNAGGAGDGCFTLKTGAGVDSVAALGDGEADAEAPVEDSREAEAAGVAEAVVLVEACGAPAVAFDVAEAAALRTSFSRTPTRRSTLCLAVSTVSSSVTAKKMQPR